MQKTLAQGTKPTGRSFLQSAIRFVLPKDDSFYDLLERQAAIVREAAHKLFLLPNSDRKTVVDAVQDLEHQGDAIVLELETALAKTFVTPLDREDLHRLSSELDDVLDYANAAARSFSIRNVTAPTKPMVAMIVVLGKMTEKLQEAVACLRLHRHEKITALSGELRALETEGDILFRDAVSALYRDDSVDAKGLIAEEQVLKDLERALNSAEDLGDLLNNVAVKHG